MSKQYAISQVLLTNASVSHTCPQFYGPLYISHIKEKSAKKYISYYSYYTCNRLLVTRISRRSFELI